MVWHYNYITVCSSLVFLLYEDFLHRLSSSKSTENKSMSNSRANQIKWTWARYREAVYTTLRYTVIDINVSQL